MRQDPLRCVYTRETIAARVREIGAEINRLYEGKSLVVVCVLKGAFMFFSDLVKELTVRPELDFVRLASYGSGMKSAGDVMLAKDVDLSLEGKHVLIVEDVIDSGHTMDFLLKLFAVRGAASLRLAVLVDKKERREVAVTPDFVGFTLDEGFIVGYGLDYAERYRELPAIYEVRAE
ncbi:MAG: hypoxanthine phosphoribosyltransferase [Deltaproteobacteria bacterium]|nr:hypoxanthine phosphoribosyltransferase [Deltaproteobacteria bacterium]